jgi:GDPmannose 4,6-dehydratase
MGVLNLLEACLSCCPNAKIYQASSSEMFGSSVDEDGYQRESTKMTPVSPYGCAKVFGYNIIRNYRNAYKLHASNGILFNHESPLRGKEFVTRKITDAVARISLGSKEVLTLGNLEARRDWGFAKEYVEAMWRTLQSDKPDTFVLATGKTNSVRDFARIAFESVGIELEFEGKETEELARNRVTGEIVLGVDKQFYRPNEPFALCGDASKAKKVLGWQANAPLEEIVARMVEVDINNHKN